MRWFPVCAVYVLVAGSQALTQVAPDNSNYWPVHQNQEFGFRISYPASWLVVPPKGPNVRFSVNPPDGPGNCNVVARPTPQIAKLTQQALNEEIEAMPVDANSWAGYAGLSPAAVTLVETRRARLLNTPALLATLETALDNLEGKYLRKQMIAITLTPGLLWSLNCGASTFSAASSRTRFAELEATFSKVFGSFALQR